MRPSARQVNELREVKFTRQYITHPEGSVLVEFGSTKVICNASVVPGVPRFLKGKNQGWLTAEYSMLPRATGERTLRDSVRGQVNSRAQEIQRFIGRALRACVDLSAFGEYTITLDCDVIQADGGTRTASITGGCVALVEAILWMHKRKLLKKNPLKGLIAAVSVGIYKDVAVLDLDYQEDSVANTDLNVVMTQSGKFIEIQGAAEGAPFALAELNGMLDLAEHGIRQLIDQQQRLLAPYLEPLLKLN